MGLDVAEGQSKSFSFFPQLLQPQHNGFRIEIARYHQIGAIYSRYPGIVRVVGHRTPLSQSLTNLHRADPVPTAGLRLSCSSDSKLMIEDEFDLMLTLKAFRSLKARYVVSQSATTALECVI